MLFNEKSIKQTEITEGGRALNEKRIAVNTVKFQLKLFLYTFDNVQMIPKFIKPKKTI